MRYPKEKSEFFKVSKYFKTGNYIHIYIYFSFQIIAMLASSSSSSSSSFNSTLLAQSSKGIGCFNLRKLVVYFVNRLAILCENTRRHASAL